MTNSILLPKLGMARRHIKPSVNFKSASVCMKLAFSVEALAPKLTGIGRYTWELAARLPEEDIESIKYFCQNRWINDLSVLVNPQRRESGKHRENLWPTLPVWCRKVRIAHCLRDRLFHGPNYFVPEEASLAIATVHDLSVFKFPETHPMARLEQFEREFHRSMARVAHIITDSDATRMEVIDFLGWPASKVTVVPLGVSPSFKPRALDKLAWRLDRYGLVPFQYSLCVSTLEPRKKIDTLLLAYQNLPHQLRMQYPLVLVGDSGWKSDVLHGEIARFSREGWLRYIGFVTEEDLPFVYSGARSFFYPSIYEGFGLPVLEAMASGVPVVTSNLSSLPEVTQGAALLVDPENVDLLSECIHRCIVDNDWRRAACARGVQVASSYTWERCVGETVAAYRHVIAES